MADETVSQHLRADQCEAEETGVFDMHDEYQSFNSCGYDDALTLPAWKARRIAQHLRGINAIVGVLQVDNGSETFTVGDFLRGGLIDAIDALNHSMISDLEEANTRAQNAAKDARLRATATA